MTKLDFMMMNLNSEPEAGRAGENELYDNENLLRAYDGATYDRKNNLAKNDVVYLATRWSMLRTEILLRMSKKA